MKTHPSRRARGFTLVELLVVIAIIAVLAGAGFAAGNAAVQRARKMTTLATATGLEQAVNNFFTEYGSMPKEGITTDTEIDTKTDTQFLNVLLGYEPSGASVLNSRGIRFLSVKEGKGNKGGLILQGGSSPSATGLFDPWGGPYRVMLDGDYNEQITVRTKSGSSTVLNGRRVAVWSEGADGASTASGKATDDVKTW